MYFPPYNCCQIFILGTLCPSRLLTYLGAETDILRSIHKTRQGATHILLQEHPSQKSCWIRRFRLDAPHKVQTPVGKNKCPNRGLHALALSGGGVLQTQQHPCCASSLYSGFQSVAGTSTARKEPQEWLASHCRFSALALPTFTRLEIEWT